MTYKSVTKCAKELKLDYPSLTDSDALKLAIEIERNEILRGGLNVSTNDSYPSALEALAIALGFRVSGNSTVVSALQEIANNIDNLSSSSDEAEEYYSSDEAENY